MSKQLRLFYAAGDCNASLSYSIWKQRGCETSTLEVLPIFQFFDAVAWSHSKALVISSGQTEDVRDASIKIRCLPRVLRPSGLASTFAGFLYGLRLAAAAIACRADYAIVNEGISPWIALAILRLFRVQLIPVLNSRKFAVGRNETEPKCNAIDRWFFRYCAAAVLAANKEIAVALKSIVGRRVPSVFEFLPTYRPDTFARIGAVPDSTFGFHVLFSEPRRSENGNFDVLEIAHRFKDEGITEIRFDVWGSKPVIEELRVEAAKLGVADRLSFCSELDAAHRQSLLSIASVVVVSDSCGNFMSYIPEAILAGRPVITSVSLSAMVGVSHAVFEVSGSDPNAYGDAILKSFTNHGEYYKRRAACFEYQPPFYDAMLGWAAALKRAIIAASRAVDPNQHGNRVQQTLIASHFDSYLRSIRKRRMSGLISLLGLFKRQSRRSGLHQSITKG